MYAEIRKYVSPSESRENRFMSKADGPREKSDFSFLIICQKLPSIEAIAVALEFQYRVNILSTNQQTMNNDTCAWIQII